MYFIFAISLQDQLITGTSSYNVTEDEYTVKDVYFKDISYSDQSKHVILVNQQSTNIDIISSTFNNIRGNSFGLALFCIGNLSISKVCGYDCHSSLSNSFLYQNNTAFISFLSVSTCSRDFTDNTTIDTQNASVQYSNISNCSPRFSAINIIKPYETIRFCEFMYNKHQTQALYVRGENVNIKSCVFAYNNGIGLLTENSNLVTVEDSYFVGNSITNIKSNQATVELYNCKYSNNFATDGATIKFVSGNRMGEGNIIDPISLNPKWGQSGYYCYYHTFEGSTWKELHPDCDIDQAKIDERLKYKRIKVIFSLGETINLI